MKKKISAVLAISMIASNSMPAINVFADEVIKDKVVAIEKQIAKDMQVGEFKLKGYNEFSEYNKKYQVKATSINNNGGSYDDKSKIENAIDGNLNTYWETRNRNTDTFTNHVIIELEEASDINRIAYATRQDGAKSKGYPTDAKIYVSESGNEDEFELAGSVTGTKVTGSMVEFKFDTVKAKKVKFVFEKAHENFASASEFWFYKEDKVLESMERLFTDEKMNKVSEEFASTSALDALEKLVQEHPFSDDFAEDIENARKILENNSVDFKETKVSKLLGYGTKYEKAYDEKFRLDNEHIVNTEVNGGTYPGYNIENMYDGDPNTHWEAQKHNGNGFTNEVIFTFDEIQNLDRIALLPRSLNEKGFPTNYEIYASETSKGETFKLVSSGTATVTKDFMQFEFNPTNFKRLKFVFKECYMNKPFISQARFYKQDALSEKMETLFTDDNRDKVNPDFATLDKITQLENEAKEHPLYGQFKEDINDAKHVIAGNDATYVDAKVSKFKTFGAEELKEYDKQYKISRDKITNITTNGRNWSDSTIDKAIDNNIETSWHSDARNNATHKNEVVITLDELETIDKVVYTSLRERGFAKKFDIYTSKTLSGNTFTKVTSGSSSITKDSIAIQFNPTEVRRVKFVFTEAHEDWALASEFGLYKPDEVLDKMNRLFTDSNITAVTEEFDTVKELDALEAQAKDHPFYGDFKEDLANARVLIEQDEIESSTAITKKFNHSNNKDYIEKFRIPYSNIKSITNNAGHHASQDIKKAADNDVTTYWETNKNNSPTWKNEVTVEFVNPITIDKIAYGARQSDRKGFLEQFEVYASNTTKGNDFHLVATGSADMTEGLVEAKFKPTTFKRLKLKWIKGNADWATLNEIMFFKQDVVSEKVDNLFTNGLMNELKPEFNSEKALEDLEKEVQTHPLKDSLLENIELAKRVLNGETNKETSRTLVAEQRGNYSREGSIRGINGAAYTSFNPFGKYVTPGEEIVVYVDADPNGPMPKLCFGQIGKGQGDWRRWVNLQPGKNVVKAPTNMNSAGVYLVNDYTPEEQPYAPRVRFEGGTSYPLYIHGETTPEEFNEQLKEYVSKIEYDDKAFVNGNPEGKVFNIAELSSENCVITTSARGALEGVEWAASKGYDVADTMDGWEEMRDLFQTTMGFDENAEDERNTPFPNKFIARVFLGVPLGYADHGYTGYLGSGDAYRDGGFFKMIVAPPQMPGNDNWAYNHEFGHIFNTKYMVHGEVTNNIYAQEYRRVKGIAGDRANWNEIMKRFKGEDFKLSHFENLAILSQINIAYGYDSYAKASRVVREQTDLIKSIEGGELRRLAVAYSIGLGVDLLDFFEGWGYTDVTDQMREAVKGLSKPGKKIEYLYGGAYDYEGNGFSDDVEITVSSSMNKENKTTTLNFGIDDNNRDDLLGYEILKDGEVIGYTKDNSFVVKDVNVDENAKYDVVAYAKDLSTAESVSIKAFQPTIETVGGVTLKLNEEFNPLDYVKATDYEGNVLTDIKFTSNVNNTAKGQYTVTYEVTANDTTVSKSMNVEVVSKYDYLSDREWDSYETQHDKPSRNNSVKGRTLGEIKDYNKGVRIHANGNLVYDLGEHNYDNFEVKVGVDMNIPSQTNSSITFKIVGDGKTLGTTKVLKHADNLQYIKVPVKGVKELRLEVNDGGNGRTSDHGVFVEPKLTTNNAKPDLSIPKSQTVKVGDTLEDLVGTYTAIDAEDGDITKDVVVSGQDKVNFNRTGNYTITYSVTDKDGNKTEKNRVISVVNMEDFKYLSEYNWKTASSGWKQVVKDKSIENREITLTSEDDKPVTYEKGLGTHAHSEIVYDLTDKNVNMFSSFVGVDREMLHGPSSVQFKVYVDGDLAYESKVMRSRDTQEFVQVDLAGAKELKLVVTNGGDSIGSDHADWADAKLYFVNEDRVYTEELTKALEEAKKLNADTYTDASYEALVNSIAKAEALLKEEKPNQEAIDSATAELQESIKGLVRINLDEVVNIPDKYLVKSLSKALGKDGNFTIGDMRKLTKFNVGYGVESLEGLQYAKNLEIINGENNEIRDLRPISKLENLKEVNFNNQFVQVGELRPVDGVVKVNTAVYNRSGKNVATKVKLVDNKGNLVKEQIIDKNTKEVDLDVRDMQSGFYAVHVTFEDPEFSGTLLYMAII